MGWLLGGMSVALGRIPPAFGGRECESYELMGIISGEDGFLWRTSPRAYYGV